MVGKNQSKSLSTNENKASQDGQTRKAFEIQNNDKAMKYASGQFTVEDVEKQFEEHQLGMEQ